MKVTCIAATAVSIENMSDATEGKWFPDGDDNDGSALAEFAGRACYQSWARPNPDTATNDGYLANIIRQQHFSVLEHGSVTFYIEDVSRSLTHELVRHRHLSYSQLSQRFIVLRPDVHTSTLADFVVPPLFRDIDAVSDLLLDHWNRSVIAYGELLGHAERQLEAMGLDTPAARKRAREAARCVLPNMTPTAIVVTGNHRAWRELLVKRGSVHADAEIRELAIELYLQLIDIEGGMYNDLRLTTLGGVRALVQTHAE